LGGHAYTPPLPLLPSSNTRTNTYKTTEIYRIVSSKALDQGEGSQNVLGNDRTQIKLTESVDNAEKKNGCC
jgi:hypothetical protein